MATRRYTRHSGRLLQFFGRHRVALANHVQRQFSELFASDRLARMHLQTLVESGDLAIIRAEGVGRPNVYEVTTNGLRSVADDASSLGNDSLLKLHRRIGSHRIHELLITEFAVGITESVRLRRDLELSWEERFGFHAHPAFSTIVPDYAFMFRHDEGMVASLVEISTGEESSTRLAGKLGEYQDWSESAASRRFLVDLYRSRGANNPRAVFRLLFVVQNRRSGNDLTRLKQVISEAVGVSRELLAHLWVTTIDDLESAGSVDAPVWICGGDIQQHADELERQSSRQRRRLLTSVIRKTRRQRLFPAGVKVKVKHVSPQPD